MNCTLCGKPVVVSPATRARVATYVRSSEFYKTLDRVHSDCVIDKRRAEGRALLVKVNRPLL